MYSIYSNNSTLSELKKYTSGILVTLLLLGSMPGVLLASEDITTDGGTVVTGDASAGVEVSNDINTNETNTDGNDNATTTPITLGDIASSTPPTLDVEIATSTTATTTILNINNATTTNEVSSQAETGNNTASGGDGNAVVDTGNAYAYANVVNVVNSNFFNSNGLLLFFNQFFGNNSLDLRENFNTWGEPSTAGCSLSSCNDENVNIVVNNENTAVVTNQVVVRSSTGGNTATSDEGGASIQTGNAYASANVVNVVNTNFTNVNYLLLSLNSFGNLDGDIVLPGRTFFERFFGHGGNASTTPSGNSQGSSVTVSNENDATVENNVSANADTGDNSADSDGGEATIVTGDAVASASTVNEINTNSFNGNDIFLLFRVYGNWMGNIFGAPNDVSWTETPFGIQVFNDSGDGDQQSVEAGQGDDTSTSTPTSLSVSNTNNAQIENDVQVYALTGENRVSGGSGASVQTGNAYAGANVVNVANTNVLGRNWILAIVNIFGDWNGNLSFGRPDLWIGGSIESPDAPIRPGSLVTYNFTITNRGDANATGVNLQNLFNNSLLNFATELPWTVADIAPGETTEVSFTATVSGDVPEGVTPVVTEVTVDENETDENMGDNVDVVTFEVVRDPSPSIVNTFVSYTPDSDIVLTKTSNATTSLLAPASVDYTIVIENNGGPAYRSTLVDTITNMDGDIINKETWDLDEIYPDEEITITYTVEFATSTEPGIYTNSARIYAIDRNPSLDPFYGWFANPSVATSSIEIIGLATTTATRMAVVEEAPAQCEQYLTAYIRQNADNNPAEVEKLQIFLRDFEGFTGLETTGVYDEATIKAVEEFQVRYKDDILGPWGIQNNTGYVYFTTQKKINELYCRGQEFPLSQDQQAEINTFRSLVDALRRTNRPIPLGQVGMVEGNTFAKNDANVGGLDNEKEDLSKSPQTLASVVVADENGVIMRTVTTVKNAFVGAVGTVVGWFSQ